ncbi:hypothetical protein [Altericroceibacterium xinjiangense]|uniref:hypothetical protein n=1 Tax=Altericroceibacterium xinjiangense TaxID=762261 RepID=UPI000F7F2DA0|nr:hypothetical protein [Altericroceibacterium xinjiangense]
MARLKVFRAVAGFENAYVAAPSRKAALEAWGAEHDLFARGQAEEIKDPELTKEPLAHPGKVIRVSRGGLEDQLKALGPTPGRKRRKAAPKAKPAKRKPPPSRTKVDAAERAIERERQRQAEKEAALEEKRAALLRQIEDAREKSRKRTVQLEQRRDAAKDAYQQALREWSDKG